MNYNNLCYRCFCEKPISEKPCPQCGYKHTPNQGSANCLPPGSFLKSRYVVGVPLGIGGFGITYKCLDTQIGVICAIKEYFPANFAVRSGNSREVMVAEQNIDKYNKIMKRFVEEARLVKSLRHRNIISIYDSFFENNTAYYVMEYCDGIDLRRYTNNFTKRLEYDEGINLLYQIMNGLEYIHSKGILHRDIAPDNIYVTSNNSIKILDFGSARNEMEQLGKELSVIVKVGYAPIEQYGGRGKQGPYTDIYALGATFYHLFTQRVPLESTQRVAEDTLERFSALRPDLPENLKYCIEKAMALSVSSRIANIAEMKSILGLGHDSVIVQKRPVRVQKKQVIQRANPQYPPQRPPAIAVQKEKAPVAVLQKTPPVREFTPQRVAPPVQQQYSGRRASLTMRLGAYAADVLVWGIVYFSVLFAMFNSIPPIFGAMSALFPLIFMLINTVFELATATTIGKAMMRMYVCARNGKTAAPSQILLRNIIKMLGIFVLVFSKKDDLLEDLSTDSIVCVK